MKRIEMQADLVALLGEPAQDVPGRKRLVVIVIERMAMHHQEQTARAEFVQART